jgi:hypothetical protein
MANTQQPSPRTCHIDIKHFVIIDWVEQDLLIIKDMKTTDNCADGLTKALAATLHHRHFDTIMGRRIPHHIQEQITHVIHVCHAHIQQTGGGVTGLHTYRLNNLGYSS